jgi:hypothetical protein
VRHPDNSFSLTLFGPSSVCCIRQQSYVSRALDRLGQHTLVDSTVARNAPGQNLAALRNKVSQKPGILEINDVYLLNAEAADSPPTKAATGTTAPALGRTTTIKIIVSAVVAPASVSVFVI